MGVLYYKGHYLPMAKTPEDFSSLKKAYPELAYDSSGLLATGTVDPNLLHNLRANLNTPMIVDCTIDGIVVEDGDVIDGLLEQYISESQKQGGKPLLEHQTYKRFGNSTEKMYRIDKGDGSPGKLTHIHVKNKHGQLYAMNVDGTPHDGSKARLSKGDIEVLQGLGFQVPDNGILEWLLPSTESTGKMLLCD